MKILVANIPLPGNRFLVDLHAALEQQGAEIEHSHEMFWERRGAYDVVHLHFPEYATFELQDVYVKNALTDEMVDAVKARLEYWAEHARIVITRHVLLPHAAMTDPRWERLYEICYSYSDVVAHFANASVDEFKTRYAQTKFFRGKPPEHVTIPHANYTSLPNDISRQDARQQLGISESAKVMLIFGAIRNEKETQLILDAFNNAKVPDKLLLVSRWREKKKGPLRRVERWQRNLWRFYYKLHPRFVFNYDFVQEEDAQNYLNAADVLFIPRFKVLNSGNVTLGMTFGKVVVGPDSWDVGELLHETGNATFDPDQPSTAAAAVEHAFELVQSNLGEQNRQLALKEWTAAQCATMYLNVYQARETQPH